MIKSINNFWLSLALIWLVACVKPAEVATEGEISAPYFKVKELLKQQQEQLEATKPQLEKATLIGEEAEQGEAKEVNWKKELRLFEQLDINKPVLARSYSIDTLVQEGGMVLKYEALDADLKVKSLTVELDAQGKPLSIEGLVGEENAIYLARRNMRLNLKDGKVESYELEGFQKVTTQDTMKYHLSAKVLW